MITIIDYGMGNLASVYNALETQGIKDVEISAEPDKIKNADKLILPGVGAFEDAMKNLDRAGLSPLIKKHAAEGRPLLGICLGFQLFFETSYENGIWPGLALLPGEVKRFEVSEPVPHMGWNQAAFESQDAVFGQMRGKEVYFYFDHAYYVEPGDKEVQAASTSYGGKVFCSAAQRDNIYAVQFHPEKSHEQGLEIMKKFAELR